MFNLRIRLPYSCKLADQRYVFLVYEQPEPARSDDEGYPQDWSSEEKKLPPEPLQFDEFQNRDK